MDQYIFILGNNPELSVAEIKALYPRFQITEKTKTALDYNTVGYVARASGLKRDARQDFPNEFWRDINFIIYGVNIRAYLWDIAAVLLAHPFDIADRIS